MATLLKQVNWYNSQFYDRKRTPKQKRVALKTKSKDKAVKLHRQREDAYVAGDYDPWTGYRKQQQVLGVFKHSTIQDALAFFWRLKAGMLERNYVNLRLVQLH